MKKTKKILVFVGILGLGIFLNRKYEWTSYLTNRENLDEILVYVEKNYLLSVLAYLGFTIIGSSVLALPGVTFALLSTALFGPWLGSLYCLIGTTVGAVFSFILSRYLLKDSIEDLVRKNDKLYEILFKAQGDRELLILMITRLLPIFPFNLQNFAYGITNISIVKYTIGTFIFMIPGILIFSVGTEGFINKETRGSMFILAGIILLFMIAIGNYLYKKYKGLTVGEKNEG